MPADQPVARQAGDADHETERRRHDDPEECDKQRVEKTNEERASVTVFRGIGDQRLGDRETRTSPEEVEAGGDPGPLQVVPRVLEYPPQKDDQADRQKDLNDEAAEYRVVEKR